MPFRGHIHSQTSQLSCYAAGTACRFDHALIKVEEILKFVKNNVQSYITTQHLTPSLPEYNNNTICMCNI